MSVTILPARRPTVMISPLQGAPRMVPMTADFLNGARFHGLGLSPVEEKSEIPWAKIGLVAAVLLIGGVLLMPQVPPGQE